MAYYTGAYVEGIACSQGPQPGALGAESWFKEAYADKGATSMGVYNCVPGAWVSIHSEGRAIDFGCHTVTDWAQNLAYALVNMSEELGVQIVIFNYEIWICGPTQAYDGFVPYESQPPHTDHLHVELTWDMANKPAEEVKKHWIEVMKKASIERPTRENAPEGTGLNPGTDEEQKEAKDSEETSKELVKGIPGEHELEGMSNYAKRLEAEKELAGKSTKIEDKDFKGLSLKDQKKLVALGEDVKSGKTGAEMANIGISIVGFSVMLYTTMLFALFLFDRTNTVTEAKALRIATFGRLDVAYDAEDEGQTKDGTNYIGWKGMLKYSLVGIVLGLILVSGAFFGMTEKAVTTFGSWFS